MSLEIVVTVGFVSALGLIGMTFHYLLKGLLNDGEV